MIHKSIHDPLDLSRWRKVPAILMGAGAVLALIGLAANPKQFGYAWLLAFMFYTSLCMGALFLVMVHHLFDASWSVPIRRFCEHISTLSFPWLALLFIPIALMAKTLFPWMNLDPHADHTLAAKQPLFSVGGFYVISVVCFLTWWGLSWGLRKWSLRQDQTGDALPTYRMRFYSAAGIFLFAVTVTLGVVMWMKSLQHQWFSTMYGVYYFAGSVWMTLGTVYLITRVLDRQRVISGVLHEHQYYYIGSLMFAFTVFYAYIHFSQYFIIWNGNMPEETFWYVVREKGTWFWVGMVIIFGHFFAPFLALLRIDVKTFATFMVPVCLWTWAMHWVDLSFNIYPVPHPEGFPLLWIWIDLGCMAFMGGLLAWRFLAEYAKHPPYPQKDPRLLEALGLHESVAPDLVKIAAQQASGMHDAPPQFGGTNR